MSLCFKFSSSGKSNIEVIKVKKEKHITNSEPENGSMAQDFEEVELLGKQMERLRTNEELKDDKMQPDPVQYQKEDL